VIQRVVGVDMSLTSTGIGIAVRTVSGQVKMAASSVQVKPANTGPPGKNGKPTETLVDRMVRQRAIAAEVAHFTSVADLVVIEAMIGGVSMGKAVDRSGLWCRIVDRAIARGIPVCTVSNSSVKKAIADHGAADKAAVSSAVTKLYPELVLANSDEADAVGMAHLGAVLMGWEVPTLARHRVIKWIDRPVELMPESVAS
jgi:crossover junction endodeoxyribonuclease RuvC